MKVVLHPQADAEFLLAQQRQCNSSLDEFVVGFARCAFGATPVFRNIFEPRTRCEAGIRIAQRFVIDVRTESATIFSHRYYGRAKASAARGAMSRAPDPAGWIVGRMAKLCWIARSFLRSSASNKYQTL